jgi:4-amino-4-deoxy-L-arabinose transferase-like glycosyltransferase
MGLAFLSKYAALYFVAGAVIHALWSPQARRMWRIPMLAAAVAAFALVIAPNVLWNVANGLETVRHTASNTAGSRHFQLSEVAEFVLSQFGVFGPIPFAVLLGGTVLLARRGALEPADRLALAFTAPPLLIILGQAFYSHANANWAAVAYLPGSLVVAGWLVRWGRRARPLTIATLAIQGLAAVAFLIAVSRPQLADAAGLSNSFKRARGWEQLTERIVERARVEMGGAPLTAVVTQDRFTFNAAAYYGRNAFGRDLPPLRMWVRGAQAENQAEAVAALTPAEGRRVLVASLDPVDTARIRADFRAVFGQEILSIWLDRTHSRRAELFVAEGFQPRR